MHEVCFKFIFIDTIYWWEDIDDKYVEKHHYSVISMLGSLPIEEHIKNRVKDYAKILLRRTGHVPIISNIARGVGFCYFHARLSEAIGCIKSFRNHLADRVSGKGSAIHKVLGLASLHLFGRSEKSSPPTQEDIDLTVKSSIEYLQRVHLISEDVNVNQIESTSKKLLATLIYILPDLTSLLRLEKPWWALKPVVEQHFIDYILHMRGSPDLILEEPKERRAIVIEWKTTGNTPRGYEKAQVVAYALLEAMRLGYYDGTKRSLIKAVTGRLKKDKIEDFKVLPIILRPFKPRLKMGPHPALLMKFPYSNTNLKKEYYKFKTLVYDVLLAAEHLTLLLTDQEFLGVPINETKALVKFGDKKYELNLLRIRPKQLKAGKPKEQDKYPCKICDLLKPCRFYFGRDIGEMEDYERTLWSLRFKVFREKEDMLLPYLCLDKCFRHYSANEVKEALMNGQVVLCDLTSDRIYIEGGHYAPLRMIIERYVYVKDRKERRGGIYRIDLLDEVRVDEQGDEFSLIGVRALRKFEVDVSGSYNVIYVVSEGKPVFVTPCDSITPLLSIGFYGRVDSVEVEHNKIKYKIGLPSKWLRYQFIIYKEYLKRMPKIFGQNVLMFEVSVDLTSYDLQAIDALQRALSIERFSEGIKISEDIKRELSRLLEESEKEILGKSEDVITLLKKVISIVSIRGRKG